jgi:electron transport complex protein RnfA
MEFILIILSAVFINNFVVSQFLGICPFLGVSKDTKSALGMGLAVTFVMTITCLITYPIYTYILVPLEIEYIEIIVFIFIIASIVQMIEMALKKFSPTLYNAMGIYLPLITTNCAVLGVALLMVQKEYGLLEGLVYSVSTALGFALALVLFAGMRERLEFEDVPKAFNGVPIALITAALLAMAFMGFSGLV